MPVARKGLRAAEANKIQQREADFGIETRPSGTKHLRLFRLGTSKNPASGLAGSYLSPNSRVKAMSLQAWHMPSGAALKSTGLLYQAIKSQSNVLSALQQ